MSQNLLPSITIQDLKKFSLFQLKQLADEIRQEIIKNLSVNGGHLSSNLGIVDLSIALHFSFSSPIDKFIFDTSHQTYTHKMLTGRFPLFNSLRRHKGLSGFSHPHESIHDPFFSGHGGTALSLSLGMAKTRDFFNINGHIIPILGDGSLNCGLTFEALNHVSKNTPRFITILNDNKMAISKNVGNVKHMLSRLLNNPISNKVYEEILSLLAKFPACGPLLAKQGQKVKESIKNLFSPASFFEQFGFSYIGPIDGHDIKKMIDTFEQIKNSDTPIFVHVITQKGKGMEQACIDPTLYHGVKPFNIETGKFHDSSTVEKTFPKIFGKVLVEMGEKDPHLIALSPAMIEGSSLNSFQKRFPSRCFDVGIAESHSVTFSGGLAYGKKLKIVVAIYSTFLQRAFDNIFHDICLQELPVVFAIDRAGLNGPDGVSHHGIYDISFLNAMPNMVICQPRNGKLLKELLENAFSWNRPTAIRYPNITTEEYIDIKIENKEEKEKEEEKKRTLNNKDDKKNNFENKREISKGEILVKGKDILIIGLGHMCSTALAVRKILLEKDIHPTVVDPIFIKPLDSDLFYELLLSHQYVVTIEEHALSCGFGNILNSFILQNQLNHVKIINCGIPDAFIHHGSTKNLKKEIGLDSESIAKKIFHHFELEKAKKEVHI